MFPIEGFAKTVVVIFLKGGKKDRKKTTFNQAHAHNRQYQNENTLS